MNKKVIFCNCGGTLLKPDFRKELFDVFKQSKVSLSIVSDLCSLCAVQKQDVVNLMLSSEEYLIIACRTRTIKLLFKNIGLDLNSSQINFCHFTENNLQHLAEEINTFSSNADNNYCSEEITSNPDWPAWYPVIDYSRCNSCGQCADFCLFGVYEKNDHKVRVVNPRGCKINCPACARICPNTAIVFPKYEHGGAIAGEDSFNETEEHKRQQKDIDAILGGEIYQALEKRKLKRQSIIRTQAMQEALREREKAFIEGKNKLCL
jgi:NAD-dependent dihydropyrimidine dehydrogenase PreA subunit